MSIGEKIKQARITKGLTRKQLSDSIGITEGGLFKIEKDERSPMFETVEKIAIVLGISLDSLR
tara:strand:- start:12 stop:200 length:189 start_codon:yes stop_codon:yes gene_type:complete